MAAAEVLFHYESKTKEGFRHCASVLCQNARDRFQSLLWRLLVKPPEFTDLPRNSLNRRTAEDIT